jgi:hypothetical protein
MPTDVKVTIKKQVKGGLSDFWSTKVRDTFNLHASEAVDELRQGSPQGATGELAQGWGYTPAKKSGGVKEFRVSITNSAPNAYFRIIGRGPGKYPPNAPIEAWVRKKFSGTPREIKQRAFLIRRKIAQEGTERWKLGKNWAGFKRNGTFDPTSPVSRAETRIAADLRKLKV